MELPVIDIVFGVVILLLMLRSLLRGLIREALSMAQWVLGLAAAFLFHRRVAAWLAENYFPHQKYIPDVLAFAGIFIIIFIVILIVGKILRDIVTDVHLGGVDHFLGALFGVLEGLLLVSLIIWLLGVQPFFDTRPLLAGSFLYGLLAPLIGTLEETVAEAVAAVASAVLPLGSGGVNRV
jgi:membrane protein required for colicin V production